MAKGGTRISLENIGNVTIKGGNRALDTLITKSLVEKLSKKDARTMDVLHEQIQAHPKTGKIIGRTAHVVLEPANLYLGAMLETLAHTLAAESSFSTSVTSGGVKRVKLQKMGYSSFTPRTIEGEGWPRLTVGYLRRIGALSQGQGTKHWWYERRRLGSLADKSGKSLGEWAQGDILTLGKNIQRRATKGGGRPAHVFSKHGAPDRFTISLDSRRRRARTHVRTSSKGKKFVVYGVTGHLVGPSVLSISGSLSKQFNEITIQSMMAKAALETGQVTAVGVYEGLALMLENESKRPWIAKFFARGGENLVKHIQQNLIATGFKG